LETATLEEISVALSRLLSTTQACACGNGRLIRAVNQFWVVVEILGNTNIAAQNQHIAIVSILDVNVAEF
jgi:hypothetical protein